VSGTEDFQSSSYSDVSRGRAVGIGDASEAARAPAILARFGQATYLPSVGTYFMEDRLGRATSLVRFRSPLLSGIAVAAEPVHLAQPPCPPLLGEVPR
jgi:hypothetical protein